MIFGRLFKKTKGHLVEEFSDIAEVFLKTPRFLGTAYSSRDLYINGNLVEGVFEELGYGIIFDCNRNEYLGKENIRNYLDTGKLWD